MQEVATLALVILPLGMTILEILAAVGDASLQQQRGGGGGGRKGTTAPAAETTRARPRPTGLSHAPATLDGEAVRGNPAHLRTRDACGHG